MESTTAAHGFYECADGVVVFVSYSVIYDLCSEE